MERRNIFKAYAARFLFLALAASVNGAQAASAEQALPGAKRGEAEQAQPGRLSRLVLLGTVGGPRASRYRAGPASLVQAGNQVYLVDCGDGTSQRLAASGLSPSDVGKVFLTHLHFDHIAGLGPLLVYNWLGQTSKNVRPVDIYGPPGISAYVADTLQGLAIPEALYTVIKAPGPTISRIAFPHDIDVTKPTVIYQDSNVKVTAVENSHYVTLDPAKRPPGAKRSYALRFDLADRSIVFTGDTGPSEAVAELARGADILVSEVADINALLATLRRQDPGGGDQEAAGAHMRKEHLSPEDVGALASRAGVKMVVLSHIGGGSEDGIDMRVLTDRVRANFAGPVIAGRDGDEF